MKRVPKNVRRLTLTLIITVVLLVAVMIVLLVKLQSYRAPELSAEAKLKQVISEIGSRAVLPLGEVPTIATVTDPDKLKDQPFFANAEVGDQVLIYPTSKRAILWRPSQSKIVEMTSLSISLPTPAKPAVKK